MAKVLPNPPKDRQGFHIGIICALSLEAEMVELVFDKRWKREGIKYGKAENDPNSYTTGAIAGHNVILTYCSSMGSNSAAQAASSLLSSFNNIKIVLVVGICGAVPFYKHQEETTEIVLGDCLISTAVIQFDLGRRGSDGFMRKDGLDGLGRAGNQIRSMMSMLQTQTNRLELTENLHTHLEDLQKLDSKRTKYPGVQHDRLYESSYIHTHRPSTKSCIKCNVELGICDQSCQELGCNDQYLRHREILKANPTPRIHFGRFGSSNTVLKSGLERDNLAKIENILAFEMEGSGVWDVCPTVVIKAACDYADSHKNKKFQPYASAVAASGLKAFLQELELPNDELQDPSSAMKLVHVNGSTNNFSHSVSHGIQAGTVHGGIHQHFNAAGKAQRIEHDSGGISNAIMQADSIIRDYNTSPDRLKIERLSGDILSLEKCYINLALIQKSDCDGSTEPSSFSLEARLELEASDPESEISPEELFDSRKLTNGSVGEPRRIYIRGRAGVGKTTLCKKIVHEFSHGRFGQALFDRLLWLPLRQLAHTNDEYGWEDLIQDAYPLSDPKWKRAVKTFSDQLYEPDFLGKTLLLLDGLDEVSQSWKQDDKMYQFLCRVISRSPNVIITSRPQANGLSVGDFDLELETLGFSLAQIDAYLEYCVSQSNTIAKMKAFMKTRPLIRGLLRIPIQLDAFCCTWSSQDDSEPKDVDSSRVSPVLNHDNITTMTLLYLSISSELCRKDIKRREGQGQFHYLGDSEVERQFANELMVLEELAFQGMVNNIISYSPKNQDIVLSHLSRKGVQLSTPYNSILGRLSFLRSSYVEQNPTKRNYHFLHLTFQEFFAARHFTRYWLGDTQLTCLQLVASNEHKRLLPFRFLQLEKYNPRYNIFWRFVTGLTQAQPHEYGDDHNKVKSIVDFFTQLQDNPVDLLGLEHFKLLMYCLSEVYHSNETAIRKLRGKIEKNMLGWVTRAVSEYYLYYKLGPEPEFPEGILVACLQSQRYISRDKTLEICSRRASLGMELASIIASLLDRDLELSAFPPVLECIFEHYEAFPQEVLTNAIRQATARMEEMQDDKTINVHILIDVLGKGPDLPQDTISALVAFLRHEDHHVQFRAVKTLAKQPHPPIEILDVLYAIVKEQHWLIESFDKKMLRSMCSQYRKTMDMLLKMLKDEDLEVRCFALSTIGTHDSIPKEFTAFLIAMLDGKDSNVRCIAAILLALHEHLPQKAIAPLSAALKDQDLNAHYAATVALSYSSSESREATIVQLLLCKDKDQISFLREFILLAFQDSFSSNSDIASVLLTILADKSEPFSLRTTAASVLAKQSSLASDAIDILLMVLKDQSEGDGVRMSIMKVLGCQSILSPDAILTLFTILQRKKEDIVIQERVAELLKERTTLPRNIILTLLTMVQDIDENSTIRAKAADVLSDQSTLSQDVINSLVTVIQNKEEYLHNRQLAAEALAGQNALSQDTITTLLAVFEDEDSNSDILSSIVYVLRFTSKCSNKNMSTLLTTLNNMTPEISLSAPFLTSTEPLSTENMISIITMLDGRCEHIYHILHQSDIYSHIADLDDGIWQKLYCHWLQKGLYYDSCCYELNGSLFVRLYGKLHQITTNSERTKQLTRVASITNAQSWGLGVTAKQIWQQAQPD